MNSNKQSFNWLIDAGLLLGFLAAFFFIVSSGIAIANWLSLAAGVYAVWKNLHDYSVLITLLLMMLKISLHWRRIVRTAGHIFMLCAATPALVPAIV